MDGGVPDAVKHLMVPLYDEFVKGYCLYRQWEKMQILQLLMGSLSPEPCKNL